VSLGIASFSIGLGELTGEGIVAVFADRIGKRMMILIGLSTFASRFFILPILSTSLAGGLVCLFLIFFGFETALVSSAPFLTELLPNARATAVAGIILAINSGRTIGLALGPRLYPSGIGVNAVIAGFTGILALFVVIRTFWAERSE
jgi:predicted MFS family arabinose efflux permease